MTPKERVLAKYPDAECYDWSEANGYESFMLWVVRGMRGYAVATLGSGDTPRQAWADAARRLEER